MERSVRSTRPLKGRFPDTSQKQGPVERRPYGVGEGDLFDAKCVARETISMISVSHRDSGMVRRPAALFG
jgi:hypothetical protein